MSDRLEAARQEIAEQVGTVERTAIGAVPATWARRFAVACGETDPVYFDDDAAAAGGWAGTPLPPLLLSSTRSWAPGPTGEDLAPDGTPRHDLGFPPGHGLRALGGGQRLELLGDALADVELVGEVELTGVTAKAGRSGELLVVELERRFLTANGELLVRCTEDRILR